MRFEIRHSDTAKTEWEPFEAFATLPHRTGRISKFAFDKERGHQGICQGFGSINIAESCPKLLGKEGSQPARTNMPVIWYPRLPLDCLRNELKKAYFELDTSRGPVKIRCQRRGGVCKA
jgi:hypothetical protein